MQLDALALKFVPLPFRLSALGVVLYNAIAIPVMAKIIRYATGGG